MSSAENRQACCGRTGAFKGAAARRGEQLLLASAMPGRLSAWQACRRLYLPFEADMRAGSTDVYQHEMPGGQYTNLKFQAFSLGLGERWEKVKAA